MNVPSDHVEPDKTNQPENQQYDEYRPKHSVCLPSKTLATPCDMLRLCLAGLPDELSNHGVKSADGGCHSGGIRIIQPSGGITYGS